MTVYFSIGGGHNGEHDRALVYTLIGLGASAVILVRARTMTVGRLPWLLLGFTQLLWAAGDAIWSVYELVMHAEAPGFASNAPACQPFSCPVTPATSSPPKG